MATNHAQPSNLLLWFAILAAPTAWSAHLSLEYFFATVQCELSGGNMGPWMGLSTAAFFVLAFVGLAAAFYARKEALQAPAADEKHGQRRLFMADLAIALSILFITGLVFATIPIIFLEPCRVS